jgi:hypothetical protein
MSFFVGTGKAFRDADIDLTREEYAEGYTLYAFDLTPDLASDGDHYSLLKTGSVRLHLVLLLLCLILLTPLYMQSFKTCWRLTEIGTCFTTLMPDESKQCCLQMIYITYCLLTRGRSGHLEASMPAISYHIMRLPAHYMCVIHTHQTVGENTGSPCMLM